MSDSPEIPEASGPFERRVALTIAIIAICLSFIGNLGDNAKTDAIIKTNEASNKWGHYQSKSIKGEISGLHADLLSRLSGSGIAEDTKIEVERLKKESERYDSEKGTIQDEAKKLQDEATHNSSINDRCDLSSLFLQIAVVVCSVSILAKSPPFWWIGIVLGVAGVVVGATAFLL